MIGAHDEALRETGRSMASTPLWFVMPSLVLLLAMGLTVAGYEPLSLEASLYAAGRMTSQEQSVPDTADAVAEEANTQGEVLKMGTSPDSSDHGFNDGTYTGYAPCGLSNEVGWQPYYVAVTIEVEGGRVSRIVGVSGSATGADGSEVLSWDPAESGKYLELATFGRADDGVLRQLEKRLFDGTSDGIDAVSGATYSSEAIFNAYADTVARAGGDSADMSSAGTGLSLPAASGTTQPDAASQVGVTPVTPSAAYADGDWTGYAPCGEQNDDGWSPYYVGVTVRVSGGKPVMITNVWGSPTGDDGDKRLTWNASESERYLGWAADGRNSDAGVKAQVNATLSAGGIVSNVDVVSGATFSSTAIARAYAAAIAKSARAAGSQVPDEPVSPSSPSTDTPSQDDDPDPGSQDVPEAEEPEDVDDKDFADGLWTGYAACGEENDDGWSPYYVAVSVETEGGSVRRIADVWGCATGEPSDGALSWDAAESQRYLDWACDGRDRRGVTYVGVLEQARSALDKGPSLESIDVVSGATFSSRAIVRAYYAAIRKAAEAAGKSYGEPADDDGEMVEGDDPADDDPADDDPADDDPADDDPAGPSGPDDNGAALTDGDYVGAGWCEDPTYEDDWDPYYVLVRILVRGGAVTKVAEIGGDSEGVVDPSFRFDLYNATYLNRGIKGTAKTKGLLEQMQSRLDAGRDASEVDVVSGATFSSKAIMEGYAHAVEQARG